MNMYDIIYKKREGHCLLKEEIDYFIAGYTSGEIPDYQASALLMAIYFQKVTKEEAFLFTDAMKRSGEIIDLSAINGIKVDKHSTGGVGDKTTLISSPLAAACGVPIAKMSGRGLGFTGGTIDKMEAIPGFQTSVDPAYFIHNVNKVGISVIGQSAHIAAADKKLYALRDVTATVENMGMITSSIMSKKLAAGSDAIVLDVKCGSGAFMKEEEDAKMLAQWMVDIGRSAGKGMTALVTDMNQPLGNAVGNALEIMEVIETLKGKGPKDITELSLQLAAHMVFLGGAASDINDGYKKVQLKLESGEGLEKLKQLIIAQGGDERVISNFDLFPRASLKRTIVATQGGYVGSIDAQGVGLASQRAGAGREKKEDDIDLSSGIVLHKKVGARVEKGDVLAVIYGNDEDKMQQSEKVARDVFRISVEKPKTPALIKMIIK